MTRTLLGALAAATIATAGFGCAGLFEDKKDDKKADEKKDDEEGIPFVAPKYEAAGLAVTARSVHLDEDGKLWFDLLVVNNTGKKVTIDRNQIQARMPSGETRPRELGMFGGMTNQPFDVEPGLSHDLKVEYMVGKDAQSATVVMGGFLVEGKKLDLPDYTVTRKK